MSATARRRTAQVRDGIARSTVDDVAVEEPLTIDVNGHVASTTMRTPGHDIELAVGWLVSEGLLNALPDLSDARECFDYLPDGDDVRRIVKVTTRDGRSPQARLHPTSSACGVCGSDVIELTARETAWPLRDDATRLSPTLITRIPQLLRQTQHGFELTGGLHAAAIVSADGSILCVREDVGRHNAVDKVIGWALLHDRLPLRESVIVVTSRASAELAHKAVRAGAPFLVAVSAPSTLAIDLAREAGLTLIGFARDSSFNVYSGEDRIGAS